MSAARNSLHGKTKAPDSSQEEPSDSAPPFVVSEKSKVIFNSPYSLWLVIAGCCGAAVLWATLRADVNQDGLRLNQQSDLQYKHAEHFVKVDSKLDSLDYRMTTIEDAVKAQKDMLIDIRVVRAIVEQLQRDERERDRFAAQQQGK